MATSTTTARPVAGTRIATLTVVSMIAFAANSLLCRLALQQPLIDPASFGGLRLASGALVLALIVQWRGRALRSARPDWLAAVMLWVYVACFSFAYTSLSAGTGALILFAAVQLTMFASGLRAGERFSVVAWFGLALAIAGLVYLVAPGVSAPAPHGAALMALAGVGWGIYSLRGRSVSEPLAATAGNFLRALPLAVLLALALAQDLHASPVGVALALVSGGVTSGLGYVIWYAALRGLTAMRAATVQLSVPPIAAIGGVLLLSEVVTLRLVVASAVVLGGVALVLLSRSRGASPRQR